MKTKIANHTRGVSMIELIGILTVLGVMVAATSGIVLKVVREQTRSQYLSQVLNLGEVYRSALSDNKAWRETVQANASLKCIKDLTDCTAQGGFFSPMDSAGKAVISNYDPANGAHGFDIHGNPCTTFNPDPKLSDGRCITQFKFRWTPIGCTAPCVNPQIQIDFDLALSIPETSSLQPVPRVEALRPTPLFRAGTQSVTPAGQSCPNAKEVVIGFEADGKIRCAPSTAFPNTPPCTCPKGGCTCTKGACSCPGQCGGKGCP